MSTTTGRHRADPSPGGAGRVVTVVVAVAGVVLTGGLLARLVTDPGDAPGPAAPPVVSPSTSSSPAGTDGEASVSPTADAAGSDPAAPSSTGGPATEPSASADVPVPGPGALSAAPAEGSPVPVSLAAPAIDLRVDDLDRLGVQPDGAIEVPADPDDAGWLTASAVPGRTGPAVVAGHVDSSTGPAVFARLGELAEGDEVVVGLDDGTEVVYRVTGTQTYPKDAFPTDAVYGPVPAPALRLLTCGGRFDRGEGSYDDNVVVYAVLAG